MKISAKRANFVSIQNSHTLATVSYHQAQVRTGYESVVAHRTPELFAKTASIDSVVTSLTKTGIILEDSNGKSYGFELGRKFGNAAGLVLPHEIVTSLKLGDKVSKGEPIIYNSGFFEPDFFNPKQLVMKMSQTVKVVLWESIDTLDDACAISSKMNQEMASKVTEIKTIVVSFDQAIKRLVQKGDKVEAETILCTIEDAMSASAGAYDEKTLNTLQIVGAQTPRAHLEGIVERVEIFYHGDKKDMTPSLRAACDASDLEMKKRLSSAAKSVFNGEVDSAMRVQGNPLMLDQIAIRVYITTLLGMAVGDKLVLGNQLKSVCGEIMEDAYMTESGQEIDIKFSLKSLQARVVQSPFDIGTSMSLLNLLAKKIVSAYKGN